MPSIPAAQLQSRLRFPPASGAIVGGREEQEDAARIEIFGTETGSAALLLIVADGMGGHAGGREASRAAVDAFAQSFQASPGTPLRPRLRSALEAANQAVAERAAASRELRGMGCTIVAAVLAGSYLRWISVGDSLLLAVKNGQVVRLNADHSLAPELDRAVREGRMTQDEADRDPDRHVLRSAVTGGRMNLIDEGARRIGEGALVLLATDGILTLPGERLARIASQGYPAERTVQSLLSAVETDMPVDQDNTTLVAAYCEGGEGPAGRRRRFRRRALGVGALLIAVLGAAFSVLILIGEDGQKTEVGPNRPSSAERRRTPPSAPPQLIAEPDSSAFTPLPAAKDENRRSRRSLRQAGGQDRAKPSPARTATRGAAENADETSRAQPSPAPRPAQAPTPPAESEPTDDQVPEIRFNQSETRPDETQSPDRR